VEAVNVTSDDLIGTGQAARLLGISSERVRAIVREGGLAAVARTSVGSVYRRADVEALAEKRAREREGATR